MFVGSGTDHVSKLHFVVLVVNFGSPNRNKESMSMHYKYLYHYNGVFVLGL